MLSSEQIERFYQDHGRDLLAYLARRCPADAAPDLLQETFLQVARQAGRLEAVALPRAWLFGIARHVLSQYTRARLNRQDDGAALPTQLAPTETGEGARLSAMREAIATLPAQLRETLELRLEQELSYEEIAGVLEIPVGTVRSRLHNAVRRLRLALLPSNTIT